MPEQELLILKFGGSILKDWKDYSRAAKHVSKLLREGIKPVVVVSAMKGITDMLDGLCRDPSRNVEIVDKLSDKYLEALHNIMNDDGKNLSRDGIYAKASELIAELTRLSWAMKVLGEVTPKVRDLILSFGERLSSLVMVAAMEAGGVDAKPFTGYEAGIITDSNFGEARPIHEASSRKARKVLTPLINDGIVPVVTGFIGGTVDGHVTTLGRGGSDYTATLLAKYLGAKEVRLYTDVPGIMSADPRIVRDAEVIRNISFDEAMELAYLGAKKFHPRTFEPLRQTEISVRVTSLDDPTGGTLISESGGPPPLKAVSSVPKLSIVSVKGAGMVGRLGTAAEVMTAVASAGINIAAIVQPVSEISISLVVREEDSDRASAALRMLRDSGFVKEVEAIENVTAVCVVGEGLRIPKYLSKVMVAATKVSHGIKLIAQYFGDRSITFITSEPEPLVKALHEVIKNG